MNEDVVERLRDGKTQHSVMGPLCMDEAAAFIEVLRFEVERLKSQRDEYLQFWKNNAEACEATEAEAEALRGEVERLRADAGGACDVLAEGIARRDADIAELVAENARQKLVITRLKGALEEIEERAWSISFADDIVTLARKALAGETT